MCAKVHDSQRVAMLSSLLAYTSTHTDTHTHTHRDTHTQTHKHLFTSLYTCTGKEINSGLIDSLHADVVKRNVSG